MKKRRSLGSYKAPIIICASALLTGIISFAVTVKLYDNNLQDVKEKNKNKIVTELNNDMIKKLNLVNKPNNNEMLSEGGIITTEEYNGESEFQIVEITEDEYRDFVSMLTGDEYVIELENDNASNIEVANSNNIEIDEKVIQTTANLEKEKLEFIMPISGEIGMEYAKENLIYSNTLDEWITHNGVDIISSEAEPVKAIENGVVESTKMDPRYGNTIIIKHNDEYKSIYSNLSTTELVYVGKKIKKGDIISGVGQGFGFESEEVPHVHLEIIKDGESVNPMELIKK